MNSEKDSSKLSVFVGHLNNLKEVRRSDVNNTNIGLKTNLFKGSESAKKLPVNEEDFSLPEDDHIAVYDRNRLVKEWNRNEVKDKLLAKFYRAFTYGLPRRIGPVLLYFLIMFYAVQYLRLRYGCVESGYKPDFKDPELKSNLKNPKFDVNSDDDDLERDGSSIKKKCYGPDPFEFFKTADYWYSRIYVWLVGIYVSIIARRYWRQIQFLPRMDRIIMVLNATIWCDPRKKEDETQISGKLTVKQLKMTIARWHLLSWTMALSSISPKLKRTFNSPKIFNDKRLLTRQEYFLLNGKYSENNTRINESHLLTKQEYYQFNGKFSEDNTWSLKWSVPLVWAHKLILQTVRQPLDEKASCIKEHKDLTNHITKFQKDLEVVLKHHGIFKPSRMAFQALTLAVHAFIIFSAVGGVADVYGTYDKESMVIKLVAIFPIYQIMKIILVIGWVITAKDLQNPFGDDE